MAAELYWTFSPTAGFPTLYGLHVLEIPLFFILKYPRAIVNGSCPLKYFLIILHCVAFKILDHSYSMNCIRTIIHLNLNITLLLGSNRNLCWLSNLVVFKHKIRKKNDYMSQWCFLPELRIFRLKMWTDGQQTREQTTNHNSTHWANSSSGLRTAETDLKSHHFNKSL